MIAASRRCSSGVGSTASFVIGNLAEQPGLGCTSSFFFCIHPFLITILAHEALLQVGLGYAIGIVLALTVCAPTSGGHFNPCVTISFAVFKGLPWRKVPR